MIERKAFALAGSSVLSLRFASQKYIPTSAEVGLAIVSRLPKLLMPLVIFTPFLFQVTLSFSRGLPRFKTKPKNTTIKHTYYRIILSRVIYRL